MRLKRIKRAIEEGSTLRKQMEGLSRKMDELGDRIAEEEIEGNVKGSLLVMCKEFER